jgi:hypothetical protein
VYGRTRIAPARVWSRRSAYLTLMLDSEAEAERVDRALTEGGGFS